MRILTVLAVAVAAALVPAVIEPAAAGTPLQFTVNTATDENDGDCEDGDCSLRDAIFAANDSLTGATIVFNLPDPSTINLTLGTLPSVDVAMTIDGTGENVTVDGLDLHRLLEASSPF